MEEKKDFASLLLAALGAQDRSQSWLATQLHVSRTTVSRWCNGETVPQKAAQIEQIALHLRIKREILFAAAGDVYKPQIQQTSLEPTSLTMQGILSGTPPTPSLVVGRENDLQILLQKLTSEQSTVALAAIRGWPGVGKTTLAATLAHTTGVQQFFIDGVLWTALGEAPSVMLGLGNWLMDLGDDPQRYPTIEGRSARLRTLLQGRKALLIIDDVWQSDHAAPFLVGGPQCRTLVTTRQPEVARALGLPAEAIHLLGVLSDEKALELLQRLAPTATSIDKPGTLRLVQELEGLPLALHVAGRLLEAESTMGWGISDLLDELIDGVKLMNAKAPVDSTDLETQVTPTIAVLFQKSTDRLDPETRERFALLGIFVPKPATFDAPAAGAAWDVADPKPTLRTLVNRGLLEPAMDGRFQMHSLLTVHARMLCEDT